MNKTKRRLIERDCARFTRSSAAVRIVSELLAIAAPTLSALLIGDMADYLLNGDTAMILSRLPYFATAVAITALVVPLAELAENILLTKYGFAYDTFLTDRFIRLPLLVAQKTEAGAVMERLEEDSAAYCFCQVFKRCRPIVLAAYLGMLVYAAIAKEIDLLFILATVLFSSLPVVWAELFGKLRAKLDAASSEYDDNRRSREHENFKARDFLQGFSLESYANAVLRKLFEDYLHTSGKKKIRLGSLSDALGLLFGYGAQILTVVLGAILLANNRLSPGALLGGVLLIPSISKWYEYAASLIYELRHETECRNRISVFYADEPEGEAPDASPVKHIRLRNISFKYPVSEKETLSGVNMKFDSDENYIISGANGSGKTTMLNLLCGLYPPDAGEITDEAGRRLSARQLRHAVSVQAQSGAIFSGTVFDNLFIDDCKRNDAAKLLGEFGFQKPLEYETAEGGENLSPGERKKLPLVRALLREASFIVLDEPTNHLDKRGADALVSALNNRKSGLILVSHREIDGVFVPPENRFELTR